MTSFPVSVTVRNSSGASASASSSGIITGGTVSDPVFSFPLDSLTGSTAAYSLRKLRSAYAGSAVQLQRASDNVTQDIGFLPHGNFDIASAIAFLSGTTGGVRTWYDQSGNANNFVQTTAANQFQFVANGSPINPSTVSSYPVLRTKNTASNVSFMKAADSSTYKTAVVDCFFVANLNQQGGPGYNGGLVIGYPRTATSNTNGDFAWQFNISGSTLTVQNYVAGSGFNNNSSNPNGFARAFYNYVYQYEFDSSTQGIYYNNHQFSTGSTGTNILYPNAVGLYIGADPTAATVGALSLADYCEIIIFGASQSSANKASLAANQGSYYTIVDPPATISTYYNGTASDGFSWTPIYNFPGFVGVAEFSPVSSVLYVPEGAGNFWSLWKCNNINNSTAMWRMEVRTNDVPDYVSSSGERSELDGAINGNWPGNTTVQVSYSLWVEPPGFPLAHPPQSWNTLGQFHYGPAITFPPTSFSFNLFNNQLQAAVDNSVSPNPYTLALTPGQWYDIFFNIRMSTTGTTDILQLWVNGVQHINLAGAIFDNENATANAAVGYWKVGVYRGDIPTVPTEAARYANLEVVDKSVTDISARIATPLAHPTHA